MGCGQSLIECTPRNRTGIGKERKEVRMEMKMMEKWTEFLEWIRRPRSRKTKVVHISINPSQSYTPKTVKEVDSRLPKGNKIEYVSTARKHEQDKNTFFTKRIRPKGAKGKRTVESVSGSKAQLTYVEIVEDTEDQSVQENVQSPRWTTHKGSVLDVEMTSMMDKMECKMDKMESKMDKMECKMDKMEYKMVKILLPGAVGDDQEEYRSIMKYQTVIDSHRQPSRSFWKRIRPKAAKGKRKIPSLKTHPSEPTPDDCLNTWMRRRLCEEGQ